MIDNLVSQVQIKATGSSIHDVNGIIGPYRASLEAINREPENSQKYKMAIEVKIWATRVLHHFLSTGNIKEAKAKYPIRKHCPMLFEE